MTRIKKALRLGRAFRFSSVVAFLAGNYVRRTGTFFALSHLKVDLLAFFERSIALGFNLRVVDKQIVAAIIRVNEAESLAWIKPFYRTFAHLCLSLACLQAV